MIGHLRPVSDGRRPPDTSDICVQYNVKEVHVHYREEFCYHESM